MLDEAQQRNVATYPVGDLATYLIEIENRKTLTRSDGERVS